MRVVMWVGLAREKARRRSKSSCCSWMESFVCSPYAYREGMCKVGKFFSSRIFASLLNALNDDHRPSLLADLVRSC